ncbi:MAG: HNH endonuclease, partial [Bdellovibrionales bacterium]|nr:HNH endonuclease [Bdellovibrionales bacterium]
QTSLVTFECLLRRAFHRYADALLMAEVVSEGYFKAKMHFEEARSLDDESSETYVRAKENFERAEGYFCRARNAIILAAVTTGLVEGYQEAGGMTTQQFRNELAKSGLDLSGQDIDHIIPKAKGGVDHPWNYQEVSDSLNRAWKDGGLFEKCLNNPIGFAKAVVINYPEGGGLVAGLSAFLFGSKKEKIESAKG